MKTQNESSLNTSDVSKSSITTTSNTSVGGSSIAGRSRTKKKRKKVMRKKKLVLSKKRKKGSTIINQQFKTAIKEVIINSSPTQVKTLKNQFEDIYLKNQENFIIFYSALKEELANQSSSPKSFDLIIQNNIFSKVKNLCKEAGREMQMDIVEHEKGIGYWKNDEVKGDVGGKAPQGIPAQDVPQNQKSQGSDSVSKKFITLISGTDFTALIAEVKKKVLQCMGETIIQCAKDNTLKMTDEGIKDGTNKIVLSKDKVEEFMINPTQTSIDVEKRKVTVKDIQSSDNLKIVTNLVPNELRKVIEKHGMIEMILIMGSFFERFNSSLWDMFGVLIPLMKSGDIVNKDNMIFYQSNPIVHNNFLTKKKKNASSCISLFADYKNQLDALLKSDISDNNCKKFKEYIQNLLVNSIPVDKKNAGIQESDNLRIKSFYYLSAVCGLLVYVKNYASKLSDKEVMKIVKCLNDAFFSGKSGKDRFKDYAIGIANPIFLKDFDSISFDDLVSSAVLYNKDFNKKKFARDNFRLSSDQMVLTHYLSFFTIMIQIELEDEKNRYFLNENFDSYFNDYYKKNLLVANLQDAKKNIWDKIIMKIGTIQKNVSDFINDLFVKFSLDNLEKNNLEAVLGYIEKITKILDGFQNKEYYAEVLEKISQNNLFVSDRWSLIKDFYLLQDQSPNQVIYSIDKPKYNVEKTLLKPIILDLFDKIKEDLHALLLSLNTVESSDETQNSQLEKINAIKSRVQNRYKDFIIKNLQASVNTLNNTDIVFNDWALDALYEIVINTTLSLKIADEIASKIEKDDVAEEDKRKFIKYITGKLREEIMELQILCMQFIEVMYLNPFHSKEIGVGIMYGALASLVGLAAAAWFAKPGAVTELLGTVGSGIGQAANEVINTEYGEKIVVGLGTAAVLFKFKDKVHSVIKNMASAASNISFPKWFSSSKNTLADASF